MWAPLNLLKIPKLWRVKSSFLKRESLQQPGLYEGISKLCLACGRVGHRREVCHYTIKAPLPDKPDGSVTSCKVDGNGKDNSTEVRHAPDSGKLHHVPESTNKSSPGQLDADGYGPWLVVTRKKHGGKRQQEK